MSVWLEALDPPRRARIIKRLERVKLGNLGDHKPLGQGLTELRENHGAGYRIYLFSWQGLTVVLLAAGDKSTQSKDIQQARKRMAEYGTAE